MDACAHNISPPSVIFSDNLLFTIYRNRRSPIQIKKRG